MSQTFVARAPGKLFLLGEYAVLDGGPAVVAAVDRHVEVRWQRDALVRVSAPECGAVEFAADRPPTIEGPLRFVIAAYHAVLARCPQLGRYGGSLSIASAMAGPGGAKIGLGSSAAVTVATVAALLAAAGADIDQDGLFATALAAHRAGQDGVGSGADVAASVYGGLVLFEPRGESLPLVTPLALPSHTKLLVAWSDESASTAGLVKQYLGATNGAAAARNAFIHTSRTCVDSFVQALSQGLLSHAAIDENGEALARLGRDLGLPVVTPRLAQLVAVARTHGAAAKISGAGGGDCGIALTSDASAAERIRAAWRAAELVPLDLAIEPTGVTVARS